MLLQSELSRIMQELGYSGLTLSALPYAFDGITQIFLQVLQPYIQQGNFTTSSTVVAANANPTLTTITVASVTQPGQPNIGPVPNPPTSIVVGNTIIVDQDIYQERTYVQAITGNAIQCMLQNPHQGIYPVNVEGGESIVRDRLRDCINIQQQISTIASRLGVKKADEVEFFATTNQQQGTRGEYLALQKYFRDELGVVCGLENLRNRRPGRGGGGLMTNY